jgi:hypothetical protein
VGVQRPFRENEKEHILQFNGDEDMEAAENITGWAAMDEIFEATVSTTGQLIHSLVTLRAVETVIWFKKDKLGRSSI